MMPYSGVFFFFLSFFFCISFSSTPNDMAETWRRVSTSYFIISVILTDSNTFWLFILRFFLFRPYPMFRQGLSHCKTATQSTEEKKNYIKNVSTAERENEIWILWKLQVDLSCRMTFEFWEYIYIHFSHVSLPGFLFNRS